MRLLLINPNSSTATTQMMVELAEQVGPAAIIGRTASRAPPMITTVAALEASEPEVIEIGLRDGADHDGVIVAAFGDPGVHALQQAGIRAIGLCAASMLEAARYGRFAVATVTPDLVSKINATAQLLGLSDLYAGLWLTPGDPLDLVGDPARLESALAEAVAACIREGAAQAVIIGGGPLSAAAQVLSRQFDVPVIAPVAAAVRLLTSPS